MELDVLSDSVDMVEDMADMGDSDGLDSEQGKKYNRLF